METFTDQLEMFTIELGMSTGLLETFTVQVEMFTSLWRCLQVQWEHLQVR